MGEMTMKELREKQRGEEYETILNSDVQSTLGAYRDLTGKIDKAADPLDVLAVLQEILEAYRDGHISGWDYAVLTRIALCSPVVQ